MKQLDWNKESKQLLRAELVRRGITYEKLADLLSKINVTETKASIDSKMSRGTFSAAFFLQCLNVIECTNFNPLIENAPNQLKSNDIST